MRFYFFGKYLQQTFILNNFIEFYAKPQVSWGLRSASHSQLTTIYIVIKDFFTMPWHTNTMTKFGKGFQSNNNNRSQAPRSIKHNRTQNVPLFFRMISIDMTRNRREINSRGLFVKCLRANCYESWAWPISSLNPPMKFDLNYVISVFGSFG